MSFFCHNINNITNSTTNNRYRHKHIHTQTILLVRTHTHTPLHRSHDAIFPSCIGIKLEHEIGYFGRTPSESEKNNNWGPLSGSGVKLLNITGLNFAETIVCTPPSTGRHVCQRTQTHTNKKSYGVATPAPGHPLVTQRVSSIQHLPTCPPHTLRTPPVWGRQYPFRKKKSKAKHLLFVSICPT